MSDQDRLLLRIPQYLIAKNSQHYYQTRLGGSVLFPCSSSISRQFPSCTFHAARRLRISSTCSPCSSIRSTYRLQLPADILAYMRPQ